MSSQFHYGEPLSASKLNSHSAKLAEYVPGGPPASTSKVGSATAHVQYNMTNTGFWLRATEEVGPTTTTYGPGAQTRKTYSYSWEAMYYDETTQNWVRDECHGGHESVDALINSDPTQKLIVTQDTAFDNTITADRPKITPYHAIKDPVTHKMVVVNSGFSGEIKADNLVIMLLGTYNDYKNCPGVPPKPPTHTQTANATDFCNEPYAWSAYEVCEYQFIKKFDMRSYGKWAEELNGGTATAMRRFYQPFFGNSTLSANLTENTTTNCKGIRFLGFSSQGSLTCTCPDWLSNVKCFKFSAKFVSQLFDNPNDTCPVQFYTDMAPWWGVTTSATACDAGGCLWQGEIGPFSISMFYEQIPIGENSCIWGPEVFDPCNPCDAFGRLIISVNKGSNSGGNTSNWYSGYTFNQSVIRGLVADCTKGPIQLSVSNYWSSCPNVFEWLKIECCTQGEINACIAPEAP